MKNKTNLKVPFCGRKIGRIREILGIKQEYMAYSLGCSQQCVSRIENRLKSFDPDMLNRIATLYGMSIETIANFNEERLIEYIKCTGGEQPSNTI